jgi:hypothetical protein
MNEETTQKTEKKDRSEYFAARYQQRRKEYHERYLKRKEEKKIKEKARRGKYYEANSVKVLFSFKDYITNSAEKMKL